MPHDLIQHPDHDRDRSLGWLATAWLEYFAVHGPGDLAGEPAGPIIDEYVAFIVDLYAQATEGVRLYDHAFLSRPKGCAKSEIASFVALFDAFGPSRFDGFAEGGEEYRDPWGLGFSYTYAPGEPLGKHIRNPIVRCLATEEDQAGLVYDTIHLNCTDGPLASAMRRRDDAGLTRILVPGGGEIIPSTASSASKDGGKETLVCFDETHLYTKPELRQAYRTLTRNLKKRRKSAGTFALETSTMFAPGEDSIAEQTYELIRLAKTGKLKRAPRQLFDHRYGDITPEDLEDEDKVRAALLDSYGDAAAWNDIDGLIEGIADPRNDTVSSFRYWFNAPTSAEDAWLAKYEWNACSIEVLPVDPPAEKDVIVLGFDGSRKRRRGVTDASALIGCRVADGLIFPIKVWEQPPGVHPEGWEVPEHDVDAWVRKAFKDYKVVGFYADPARWESVVASWEARFGPHLQVKSTASHPVEWWMTGERATKSVRALEEFENAVLDLQLRHTADPTLTAHVLNARRRITTKGVQIAKENPDSPNKIDAAVAAVLAWQCRLDAVAKGIGLQRGKRVARRLR
ncbi:terminase [Nocardia cyriacigeorgica]|uniref:terminase n=1 Tax=Nocardia cyriacigeorgica TaxID=135487 RepID=UPI001892EA2E|nr:terminase [Nocardia cyriacigeorgica]MBF6085210.1 terminase [Nocardia cyriacigeorgica]